MSENILTQKNYASLHNHTDYSNIRMLDSTNRVDTIINRAIELKLQGLAITDHESLSGHVKALKYIQDIKAKNPDDAYIQNFKLMLGNEIYLCRNDMNKDNYEKDLDKYYHFILIAKDKIGHHQLRELSSRAWSRSYYQFIERVPTFYSDLEEIIEKDKGHMIASSACLGGFISNRILEIGSKPASKEKYEQQIEDFILWAKRLFQEDFYLELQPSTAQEQIYVNKYLIEIGKKYDLKCIITTDSHYLNKDHREVHKAYLNAGEGDREVDAFYSSTYLMGIEELSEYLGDYIEEEIFNQLLMNTLEISSKCDNYDIFHNPIVPTINIDYTTLEYVGQEDIDFFTKKFVKNKYSHIYNYATSKFDQDKFLYAKIIDGLQGKFNINGVTEEMLVRIDTELKELWEISEKLGERLSAYLITVSKIIELIWHEGDSLVGPSRGSALGFFINYLLDITQISPLNKEIPLEHWRFINASRVSLPDYQYSRAI